MPVYALVVAKGGPKLTPSKEDSGAVGPGQPGRRSILQFNGNGRIEAHGSSMDSLTHAISPMVGRTILDKTGLTGSYDYTLTWTPDMMGPGPGGPPPGAGPGGPGGPPGETAPDPNGPTLFTALQEELGLKLESQKGPVDVIVIDHIDPPTPN